MGNVLVAIVTLIIGFVLASYGVYANVEASRRSQMASMIGSTMEREAQYLLDLREENGHWPLSSVEEAATGYSYYDSNRFARDAKAGVTFFPTRTATGYWMCASAADVGTTMNETMALVVKSKANAFVSGACGDSAASATSARVVSMKLGV